MMLSLTEDFKTLGEFEKQPLEIASLAHRTGRPVVITKNGKPDLVVMDANTYEWQLHCHNLKLLLAEGEADIRAGRCRPIEEFFAEVDHEKKLPRNNQRKRRK